MGYLSCKGGGGQGGPGISCFCGGTVTVPHEGDNSSNEGRKFTCRATDKKPVPRPVHDLPGTRNYLNSPGVPVPPRRLPDKAGSSVRTGTRSARPPLCPQQPQPRRARPASTAGGRLRTQQGTDCTRQGELMKETRVTQHRPAEGLRNQHRQ